MLLSRGVIIIPPTLTFDMLIIGLKWRNFARQNMVDILTADDLG